ncbi:hypothetical protein Tco_1313828 [Tanacetum coccineum]
MEMWSGHPSNYGMLRIFGCVAYPHDKQGKLEPRAIKCVLLRYLEGVKGYKLHRLDDESPKIVEVELQRLNNHTPEEDQTDQEDCDDEDAGDQETDQTSDLIDYQLARDRERRTRNKPLRFRDVGQLPEINVLKGSTQRLSEIHKFSVIIVEYKFNSGLRCGDVFDLIGDVDPTDEDGDIGMGDSTGVSASLGGEIFSGRNKCKRASEAKRSLVKSSKKLEEVFPGEAGK